VAALLRRLEQKVDQQQVDQREDGLRVDRRNRRTWRQLILGVVVMRSTRLLALGRMVAPQRRAGSVKAAAQGLASFGAISDARTRPQPHAYSAIVTVPVNSPTASKSGAHPADVRRMT